MKATMNYFKHLAPTTPLWVWVSLSRLFSTRFLGKVAEVVSQKFSQLEEPVSKIISALIVILYNATYAHTRTLTKPPRKTLESCLLLEFTSISSNFFMSNPREAV